jgi:hypothetical protein
MADWGLLKSFFCRVSCFPIVGPGLGHCLVPLASASWGTQPSPFPFSLFFSVWTWAFCLSECFGLCLHILLEGALTRAPALDSAGYCPDVTTTV